MKKENINSNAGFASLSAIISALVALGLIGGGATYVYNEINDEYKDDYYEYEYENRGAFGRFAENGVGRYVDQMPWRQDHEDKGDKGHNPAGEIANLPKGDLSDAEKEALVFRREEEKFARDVYIALYEKWDMKVFDHIKESEEKHMEASKALLERYGIQDPVENVKIGEFKNEKLQQLYNEFVQRGSLSKLDAIKVGLEIEELDIKDLRESLQETNNEDIKTVLNNILRASRNHMRALAKELKVMGGNYEPKHLSVKDYESIVGSDIERGRDAKDKWYDREGFGRGMNGGMEGYGRYEKYYDEYRDGKYQMDDEYHERGEGYGKMMRGQGRAYMDDDYQEYSYKKLYDENYINPSQLPAKIQSYIDANYPGARVIKAEAKGRGYFEVKLSNGVELKFNKGELIYKEREGDYDDYYEKDDDYYESYYERYDD